jgi:hypothetical protein
LAIIPLTDLGVARSAAAYVSYPNRTVSDDREQVRVKLFEDDKTHEPSLSVWWACSTPMVAFNSAEKRA